MTERQWLRMTGRLDNLIEHLQEHCSPSLRKQELLCVAYCRRIWRLITDERSRNGVDEVEAIVHNTNSHPVPDLRSPGDATFEAEKGNGTNWQAARAVERLVENSYEHHCTPPSVVDYEIGDLADNVLAAIWADRVGNPNLSSREFHAVCDPGAGRRPPAALAREMAVQCYLLRDIFGNPFRPVTHDPTWLTTTVVLLARQMYESQDFSPMPILADALQDAGCENAQVLDHCRGDGPHVRGCWVVDLLLGKS